MESNPKIRKNTGQARIYSREGVDKIMNLSHYYGLKEFLMEAYREIIAGSKLAEVIDLPERLKQYPSAIYCQGTTVNKRS